MGWHNRNIQIKRSFSASTYLAAQTLGIRAPPRGMGMFLYTTKERNPTYGVIIYYPDSKSRETEHGGSETWAGREQGGGCDGAWVEPPRRTRRGQRQCPSKNFKRCEGVVRNFLPAPLPIPVVNRRAPRGEASREHCSPLQEHLPTVSCYILL